MAAARPPLTMSRMTFSERRRIAALDVVRGVALCGILVANVAPIASAGGPVVAAAPEDPRPWLGLFVHHRFFPIFALLFGIGFALLVASAAARTARPRLVLLRRLAVLLAVGLAHFFLLWQGDILSTYAVVGIVVLLPSTWLPRQAVAALAAAFLAVALAVGDQRFLLVAGLFLLGAALVRYGVVARIEESALVPAVLALLCVAGAVPLLWWQTGRDAQVPVVAAGLLLACAYVCVVLLVLRSPARPVLVALFAPLGRMALTNYLTATVLVLVVSRVVGGRPEAWATSTLLLVPAAILVVQWAWSVLWLRHFRQGPLEWLWRWATWARRPPLRVRERALA
ncbi:hypothetical protein JCM33774_35000 [Actinophytocola sp. KF-1]